MLGKIRFENDCELLELIHHGTRLGVTVPCPANDRRTIGVLANLTLWMPVQTR